MSGLEMKYFVLKPKGDNPYARASRSALLAYASEINNTNPEMARELVDWVDNEIPDPEEK